MLHIGQLSHRRGSSQAGPKEYSWFEMLTWLMGHRAPPVTLKTLKAANRTVLGTGVASALLVPAGPEEYSWFEMLTWFMGHRAPPATLKTLHAANRTALGTGVARALLVPAGPKEYSWSDLQNCSWGHGRTRT